jgi:hypothetical protein
MSVVIDFAELVIVIDELFSETAARCDDFGNFGIIFHAAGRRSHLFDGALEKF